MQPLRYGSANWLAPQISSHNNYVDLFAQTGLLGLGLFVWAMAAIGRIGWRASHKHTADGFVQGYRRRHDWASGQARSC